MPKGFKRGRYGARLETSARIVETLRDIDVLRAVTCAFAAFDAIAHQLGLTRPHRARRKILRQARKPAVRIACVVGGETPRDIDAFGTRHAVAAARTGHAIRFLKLSQHTRDGIELLCRHRIRQCAIRQCRVLVHLRGIGHARKQHRDLRMVPHPRKSPSSRRLQVRIAYVIEHGAARGGSLPAKRPPSSGSITNTASPRSAAAMSPAVPAW